MDREDEGVLARWSRRKRQSEAAEDEPASAAGESPGVESEARAADSGVPAAAEGETAPAAPAEEERALTEADLPDIEALSYESDFTVFMKRNVPLALQKRALRKLWESNPVLANLDGLNDHDLDYTIAEMKEIAAQSAADLASGAKRLNVMDLRAKDREMRRLAAGQKPRQPIAQQENANAEGEDADADAAPHRGEGEADADLAAFVSPPAPKLDS